ncbi:MAG: hypothetical protein GYB68_03790, partial [Chloroflexi bacterium]|nr:hypothetical protein [Chloroflexota bacterium]
LYSGAVKNPRELTELQDKMKEYRDRYDAAEEPLLEAMMRADEWQEKLSEAKTAHAAVLAENTESLEALTEEQAALEARKTDLDAEISEVRPKISQEHLSHYDRLRKGKTGIAVAVADGPHCGVCGVEFFDNDYRKIKRGEIVPCSNCTRIPIVI